MTRCRSRRTADACHGRRVTVPAVQRSPAGHPGASAFERGVDAGDELHARLIDIVDASEYVNADETPLPIVAPEKCRKGFVWTFLADGVITYVYSASRAGETAVRVLGDSRSVIQVDGYSGYNKVTTPGARVRSGCWAHIRRYFIKALPTAPEAEEVMDLIADLYAIEYLAQEKGICGTEAHRVLRDTESRRIVEKIEAWMEERQPATRPSSPLGKAIGYTIGQRASLCVFLDDPKVGIDNNISERALRIVALGRKNFLFAGNDGAAFSGRARWRGGGSGRARGACTRGRSRPGPSSGSSPGRPGGRRRRTGARCTRPRPGW